MVTRAWTSATACACSCWRLMWSAASSILDWWHLRRFPSPPHSRADRSGQLCLALANIEAMKYALDCSTAGTFSDARLLAELAAEAEEAGWDGFFLWDAVFARPARLPMVDPWIALAAIA